MNLRSWALLCDWGPLVCVSPDPDAQTSAFHLTATFEAFCFWGPVLIQSVSIKGLWPPCWECACVWVVVFENSISQGGPFSFLWSLFLSPHPSFCVYQAIFLCVVVAAQFSLRTPPTPPPPLHTHTHSPWQTQFFGIKLKQNHSGPALGNTAEMNWPLWRPSVHKQGQTELDTIEYFSFHLICRMIHTISRGHLSMEISKRKNKCTVISLFLKV